MTTLTEFLLARIVEDEADRHGIHDVAICSSLEWGGMTNLTCDCGWPERVLAECEAKRRIVEAHRAWDENEWQSPPYFSAPMDEVLALLALPYADHPDYREEWRP